MKKLIILLIISITLFGGCIPPQDGIPTPTPVPQVEIDLTLVEYSYSVDTKSITIKSTITIENIDIEYITYGIDKIVLDTKTIDADKWIKDETYRVKLSGVFNTMSDVVDIKITKILGITKE